MHRVLAVDPRRCTGCRTCELVCSQTKTGQFRPAWSAIRRVTMVDELGFQPWCCLQCADAPCKETCPMGAIRRTPEGWLTVETTVCIGCSVCSLACPFGNIKVMERHAVKCDTCDGEPLCVKWCPSGALALVDGEEILSSKRLLWATACRKHIVSSASTEG